MLVDVITFEIEQAGNVGSEPTVGGLEMERVDRLFEVGGMRRENQSHKTCKKRHGLDGAPAPHPEPLPGGEGTASGRRILFRKCFRESCRLVGGKAGYNSPSPRGRGAG